MDEANRIDAVVSTIRNALSDPQSIAGGFPLEMFDDEQRQFLRKTLHAVVSAYQDREIGVTRHVTLVWVLSDALAAKADTAVNRFHLCLASFMHDVGKAAVGEPVFMLPQKLTEEEDREKKRHTVLGGEICQRLGKPFVDIASFVRGHHENWDGTGYPNGLAGAAIPVMARLLRMSDVISALRTKRHYREAFSKEETLTIIRRIQSNAPVFDPLFLPFASELVALT